MSIYTRHTTRIQARDLNSRLKLEGFESSTAKRCYDYVSNIVDHFGGSDLEDRIGVVRECACATWTDANHNETMDFLGIQ